MAPAFAGAAAVLDIVISSPGKERYGLGLRLLDATTATLAWTNIPAGGQAIAHVSFVPATRGLHDVPTLSVETRFPLGLFRAWTVWRPRRGCSSIRRSRRIRRRFPPPGRRAADRRCRAGSKAARSKASVPTGAAIRSKLVAWKKAAQALETGA